MKHGKEVAVTTDTSKRRFALGQFVMTPGVEEALQEAGQSALEFLARHSQGDWGEVSKEDRQANNRALKDDQRLLSAYTLRSGKKIWIITEWDRSVTTVLLPSEY